MPSRKRRQPHKAPGSPQRRSSTPVILGAALLIICGGLFLAWRLHESSSVRAPERATVFRLEDEKAVFSQYAGSESCKRCHEEAFAFWQQSHHGLAERPVDPAEDRRGFDPPQEFGDGIQKTEVAWIDPPGLPEIVVAAPSGKFEPFRASRVIGNSPLRQFLVPLEGGRWQALEACYDPRTNDWFNLYAGEYRRPGEWGHWTGRGMNWNHMCATCHNTRLRKNYSESTDSYRTTMAEMTVGCEACHGPMKAHNEWQERHGKSGRPDPTITKLSREQVVDNCAFCHARRADLTGDFKPGDSFYDHMRLSIVDHTDIYHPDGQVRDENYEFSAFLGSRMRMSGVWCMDCHEPHSAKRRLPGNWLCMRCHDGGNTNAPTILPVQHSRHRVFGYDPEGNLTNLNLASYKSDGIKETGGECINCHMPQTVYMQRHWRHDHGFTIPDPQMTAEFGIPNACNRCHQDKDTAWAVEWAEKWYGDKLKTPVRERTRWIARARQGDPAASEPLMNLLASEPNPYWRAVAANLLGSWASDPQVLHRLIAGLKDPSPLVRVECASALGALAEAGHLPAADALRNGMEDSSRSVRVASAWALRATTDPSSRAGSELLHSLDLNADQPVGQLQKGLYALARNGTNALEHFKKAVEWDPYSPGLRIQFATTLSGAGDHSEALNQLQQAAEIAPQDAEVRFQLALAYNEKGDLRAAETELRKATELDPRHARAWYNLGLAQNALKQPILGLESLSRAEAADPRDPRVPYARATILMSLGRTEEARTALGRVLAIRADHPEALRLLERLK